MAWRALTAAWAVAVHEEPPGWQEAGPRYTVSLTCQWCGLRLAPAPGAMRRNRAWFEALLTEHLDRAHGMAGPLQALAVMDAEEILWAAARRMGWAEWAPPRRPGPWRSAAA